MIYGILVVSAVIFLCILANKFSDKFGMPTLILFMFIGMLFGSDGIVKIPFDNYELAERVCSIALIFIMFYGGFNTKWKLARPVAARAVLLSTVGVAITGCHRHTLSFRTSFFDGRKLLNRCGSLLDGCRKRLLHIEAEKAQLKGRHSLSS